jgi:glycosyltransferase involved in cell wall biosynthesis
VCRDATGAPRVSVDARYLKRADVGISVYLSNLIDDLVEQGGCITLLTDEPSHVATLFDRFPGAHAEALVRRSGMAWEQRDLAHHLRRGDYDVHLAGANYGLPLLYRGPTVLALVVYDLIPLRYPRRYLLRRPGWAAKYLISMFISFVRVQRIIAISNATAADVRRLRRRVPVTVRYPSVTPPPPTSPIVPPLPERFFLYHGGHDVRKNVPLLLAAYARYRERCADPIDLVVLGNGWGMYDEHFRALGLGANVHRLGYVDEATKHAVIARAACVLYPSDFEGYGLPVAEALVHGIPVVSGTGGSLREVGGQAVIYADPHSTDSFVDAMTIATSPGERERARHAGPARVRELSEAAATGTILDALVPATRTSVSR